MLDRQHLPNLLTLSRLPLIVIVAILLFGNPGTAALVVALILFLIAAVTDFVDGYLARRWQVTSEFGRVADTTVDKLTTVIPMLSIAFSTAQPQFIYGCILLMTARELLLPGLREGLAGLGYLQAIPTHILGKIKMHTQVIATASLILGSLFPLHTPTLIGMMVSVVVATVVTWISGASYILRAIRLLRAQRRS